jgi:hypothetical protein
MPAFQSPEWFLLLPALLLLGWFWKRLRLFSPLRLTLAILASLILADPSLRRQDDALDLWVLLDRSASTEDLADKGLPEWRRLLESSKPTRRDRIHYINFAGEVAELGADGDTFTGSRKLTRTNLALQHVASLADPDCPSRVLLFTDGYATEPLQEAAAQLEARGIPLDFRLIREETPDDFRLARMEMPDRVQAGEPFPIEITVRGSKDIEIPLVISRSGHVISETSVRLVNGVGKAEFTDRIPRTGSFEYEALIRPQSDSHPGNNSATRTIEATGGPRVILATSYTDDPAAKALANLGANSDNEAERFTVETITDPSKLRPGLLTGARAVVFNNIPAFAVPTDFLEALNFYVKEQGGGFLMAGGKQSFGAGGYFQSAIDPLLPVSMELKTEHRKLAVAIAIVMDRSGSMGVTVDTGGGKTLAKMDLADAGASNAIGLLGAMDQVAVVAVDSAPHEIVPLMKIGAKQEELQARVRKVRSEGGGIYIYEGLKAGWEQLQKSNAGTRHVILFADACDSEEPGNYQALVKTMTDAGCTVSVIGMGSHADCDAKLLEDIAKRGNGRIFFADRPIDIPTVFAQETVSIARSAFLKDSVHTKSTGRWSEISPKPLAFPESVDGYNLSYARDDTTVSLASADEYLAPLVSHARRGLGRTAAVSFPLAGEYSEQIRSWPGYSDFLQTLGEFLVGSKLPPGLAIRQKLDGTRLTVDLLYDTAIWSEKLATTPPRLRLAEYGMTPTDVSWIRIAPGKFSATRDLEEGKTVRGAIQIGTTALPFGPLSVGSSVEWEFDPDRIAELRAASAATKGRELLDLSKAWLRPPFIHQASLRMPLLLILLITLLADALFTRTGWRLPLPAMPKHFRITRRAAPAKQVTPPQPITKHAPDHPADVPTGPDESERRSRYQRAKDKR